MSDKYKATKAQMLMKKMRRCGMANAEMCQDLGRNNGMKKGFVDMLARTVKGYEMMKDHRSHNFKVR